MHVIKEITVSTHGRDELVDITTEVQAVVAASGAAAGVCHVFVPHTTAGVTINEGADPAVKRDIIMELDRMVPHEHGYSHSEGNSAAHIKATLVGSSETVLISGGRLALGTWQAIYFCEFDGPRTRRALVRVIST